MFTWPWIEDWVTKDKREHHLLDRPRNAPFRTGIGVAGVIFYCVMWAAASLRLDRHALPRVAERRHVLAARAVLPRPDHRLHRRPPHRPGAAAQGPRDRAARPRNRRHRDVAGRRVLGTPRALDEYKLHKLVHFEARKVIPAQPNAAGHISRSEKRRGALSKFFFEDRVAPVTPSELAALHAEHGHGPAEIEDSSTESSRSNICQDSFLAAGAHHWWAPAVLKAAFASRAGKGPCCHPLRPRSPAPVPCRMHRRRVASALARLGGRSWYSTLSRGRIGMGRCKNGSDTFLQCAGRRRGKGTNSEGTARRRGTDHGAGKRTLHR